MTIYLDCNATTPMDPEVAKVVRHYMEVEFGNAGSRTHEFGLRAKQAVERAREQVAAVVDAKPDEVIFTSGATEANNLAILGLEAEGRRTGKMHIVSTQIEHKAVLEPLEEMERRGFEVTLVAPTSDGWVDPEKVAAAIRGDTLLVSVMHVNNETGVVQDVAAIAQHTERRRVLLHVDAAQGFGKEAGLHEKAINLISASAHKIAGPKGVGLLVLRRQRWAMPKIKPIMFGGRQERHLRPGTLPVALIAGLGEAASRIAGHVASIRHSALALRRDLQSWCERTGNVLVGGQARVLPSTAAILLRNMDSEAAILALRGRLALSNGAACTSEAYTDSHVLRAMGVQGRGFLRLSWMQAMTSDQVHDIIGALDGLGSLSRGCNTDRACRHS